MLLLVVRRWPCHIAILVRERRFQYQYLHGFLARLFSCAQLSRITTFPRTRRARTLFSGNFGTILIMTERLWYETILIHPFLVSDDKLIRAFVWSVAPSLYCECEHKIDIDRGTILIPVLSSMAWAPWGRIKGACSSNVQPYSRGIYWIILWNHDSGNSASCKSILPSNNSRSIWITGICRKSGEGD